MRTTALSCSNAQIIQLCCCHRDRDLPVRMLRVVTHTTPSTDMARTNQPLNRPRLSPFAANICNKLLLKPHRFRLTPPTPPHNNTNTKNNNNKKLTTVAESYTSSRSHHHPHSLSPCPPQDHPSFTPYFVQQQPLGVGIVHGGLFLTPLKHPSCGAPP